MESDYVVCAVDPPGGCLELWGGELQNDRPYCEHVKYRVPRGDVLLYIRTVFAEPVPPPVIRTVENLSTILMNFRGMRERWRPGDPRPSREHGPAQFNVARRDDAATCARETVVVLDDAELRGTRKDFADCSIAEFAWDHGTRIFCAGRADLLDDLRLRTR